MPTITIAELQAHLDHLDDGVLRAGAHQPGREFCANEFKSQVDGVPWTDSPTILHIPDIRPLNDGPWSSDQARTAALLPLMVAIWDWADWSPERQQEWAQRVAIETVCQITPTVRVPCEGCQELDVL